MTKDDIISELHKAASGHKVKDISNETGIDKATLYRIFKGDINPTLEKIVKIAECIGKEIVVK